MSRIEAKLQAMGHSLPQPRKFPNPNRCGCVCVGNILFVSGHGPHHPGMKIREHGMLGQDITVEEG
jgi:enamine deaminase RidA (YjgF/YER057c/UK114 family)